MRTACCRKPGKLAWSTLLICLACAVLDVFHAMPHPPATLPEIEDGGNSSICTKPQLFDMQAPALSSSEVREAYVKALDDWSVHMQDCQKNYACRLAKQSVGVRHSLRVEARWRGSALAHAFFIVRDWFVYGMNNSFSYEEMIDRKRKKMARETGQEPTDPEVCQAVLDSSTRANSGYTKSAAKLGKVGFSYQVETAGLHLIFAIAMFGVTLLVETIQRCLRRSAKEVK